MKTNQFILLPLLALGGLTAFSPIARADDAPATPPPPASGADASTNAPAGRPNMREQMEKLFKAIKATDDQKEKLKPIFKERNQKFKELRDDTSLAQPDRAAKRKEITKDINAKVKDILSDDQFKEYQKFQREQAKQNHNQPPPSPADNPPKN
jgi:Spy/CpxP family protein refolding chaperone